MKIEYPKLSKEEQSAVVSDVDSLIKEMESQFDREPDKLVYKIPVRQMARIFFITKRLSDLLREALKDK